MSWFKEILLYLIEPQYVIAFVSLIISIVAMFIAKASLELKRGHRVEGDYQVFEEFTNTSPFVKFVYIRNLKDRALTIYNIYVRFGQNLFLDLLENEENKEKVYILQPFETLTFQLGPAILYLAGADSIDIRPLLQKGKKGTIILSTSEGLINVISPKKFRNPYDLWFRNMRTAVLQPRRFCSYENYDKNIERIDSYGDKLQYIVTRIKNGEKKIYPVYSYDTIEFGYLRGLNVKKEDLENKERLKTKLMSEKRKGTIQFETISIEDMRNEIRKYKNNFSKDLIGNIRPDNWFVYHIFGKIQTFFRVFADRHQKKKSK